MKKLSRKEMKSIKGGASFVLVKKWNCYEPGGAGPYVNCKATNPATICGYETCIEIGTCPSSTSCS